MFSIQMHLALYCFANGQLSTALKLLYRARYLLLLVSGEDHPEMALLDVSVALLSFRHPQTRMHRLVSSVDDVWRLSAEQHWTGAAWCDGV